MSKLSQLVLAAMFVTALAPAAHAGDPRCNAPPYGSTAIEFQAFVRDFSKFVVPAHMLAAVCNAKYGSASRAELDNLGFTDEEIDAKDTVVLAVNMIVARTRLADAVAP